MSMALNNKEERMSVKYNVKDLFLVLLKRSLVQTIEVEMYTLAESQHRNDVEMRGGRKRQRERDEHYHCYFIIIIIINLILVYRFPLKYYLLNS